MNCGAVVINIVGLIIGFTKFTNLGSENIAAFSPLSPVLQGLLNQRIHERVNDISVDDDCPGEPRKRVADLRGSEHNNTVIVQAGTREDVALPDEALVAAAAILVNAEDTLQIVLSLCAWNKSR